MITAEQAVWVLQAQNRGQYKERASWTNQTEFKCQHVIERRPFVEDTSLDKQQPNPSNKQTQAKSPYRAGN